MTMAAFVAAIEGYVAAHAPASDSGIDDDEFTRVLAEEIAAGRA